MAIVNGPSIPLLTYGKAVKLGTILTVTDGLRFSLPNKSDEHLGHLFIQTIANGTLTAFTADVRASLDGGTTFTAQFPGGGTTLASNTAGMDFATHPAQNIAIPTLGGEIALVFQAATLTFGTATKIDVWAIVS